MDDQGEVRRRINKDRPNDEAQEEKEFQRRTRAREILWEHVEACHERFQRFMEKGENDEAHCESELIMRLMSEWHEYGE